jgi:hypothetical protein
VSSWFQLLKNWNHETTGKHTKEEEHEHVLDSAFWLEESPRDLRLERKAEKKEKSQIRNPKFPSGCMLVA